MKLLTTLVVAAFGQDYDFYSSGEAYRFGSVGDFSHTTGYQPDLAGTANDGSPQEDGFAPPLDMELNSASSPNVNAPGNVADPYLNSQAWQYNATNGPMRETLRYLAYGHGGNRRYCHTTRHNRAVYNWTSHKFGGYFAEGRNFMECMGEELYCFIEERAHYGQIIGITAGCEQMMNHPSVTIQDQQQLISNTYTQINAIKNNYNQEAARGGANRHGFFTYYGLGGCLAMPAQNGHHYTFDRLRPPVRGAVGDDQGQERELISTSNHRIGVDSASWRSYKWLNYYRNYHGGYGQNQCLRFPKQRLDDNHIKTADVLLDKALVDHAGACKTGSSAPVAGDYDQTTCVGGTCNGGGCSAGTCAGCGFRVKDTVTYTSPGSLLPFGVSVCRACCVAEFSTIKPETFTSDAYGELAAGAVSMLCNYPPDTDSVVYNNTNDQFEELVPRFDMAGAAFNAFQTPNQNDKQWSPERDNNLFVHGSWCSETGPARGCARVPKGSDHTETYLWGWNAGADATFAGKDYGYTCENRIASFIAASYAGISPISAPNNRDWCPGRPWLARTNDDLSHKQPDQSATTTSSSGATVQTVNIVG
jgi:hypothetical protein